MFIAPYTDGPYIFTIPFSGKSKGSQPRLNMLFLTSQANLVRREGVEPSRALFLKQVGVPISISHPRINKTL